MKTVWLLLIIAFTAAGNSSVKTAENDRYIVIEAALKTNMPEIAMAELHKIGPQEQDRTYWLLMGRTLRALKRPLEAIDMYSQCIELNPSDAAGYNGLGMAYVESGNLQNGETFLIKATNLAPMEPSYYHDLGKYYLLRGNYKAARQPLAIALRIGGNKDIANHLAIAMTLSGDEEQAKKLLMEYYDLHEVYCLLAEAYELGGYIPEAVDNYQMSLRARHDYPRARERLERLIGERE